MVFQSLRQTFFQGYYDVLFFTGDVHVRHESFVVHFLAVMHLQNDVLQSAFLYGFLSL